MIFVHQGDSQIDIFHQGPVDFLACLKSHVGSLVRGDVLDQRDAVGRTVRSISHPGDRGQAPDDGAVLVQVALLVLVRRALSFPGLLACIETPPFSSMWWRSSFSPFPAC